MAARPEHLNPSADEYPAYQAAYLQKVGPGDLFEQLRSQPELLRNTLESLSEEEQLFRYAPGKWSVREVLGHINDTERIFSYRALRIARGDQKPLPGFEQDDYVLSAHANSISVTEHLAEFEAIRTASLFLLKSLQPDDLWYRQWAQAFGEGRCKHAGRAREPPPDSSRREVPRPLALRTERLLARMTSLRYSTEIERNTHGKSFSGV